MSGPRQSVCSSSASEKAGRGRRGHSARHASHVWRSSGIVRSRDNSDVSGVLRRDAASMSKRRTCIPTAGCEIRGVRDPGDARLPGSPRKRGPPRALRRGRQRSPPLPSSALAALSCATGEVMALPSAAPPINMPPLPMVGAFRLSPPLEERSSRMPRDSPAARARASSGPSGTSTSGARSWNSTSLPGVARGGSVTCITCGGSGTESSSRWPPSAPGGATMLTSYLQQGVAARVRSSRVLDSVAAACSPPFRRTRATFVYTADRPQSNQRAASDRSVQAVAAPTK